MIELMTWWLKSLTPPGCKDRLADDFRGVCFPHDSTVKTGQPDPNGLARCGFSLCGPSRVGPFWERASIFIARLVLVRVRGARQPTLFLFLFTHRNSLHFPDCFFKKKNWAFHFIPPSCMLEFKLSDWHIYKKNTYYINIYIKDH